MLLTASITMASQTGRYAAIRRTQMHGDLEKLRLKPITFPACEKLLISHMLIDARNDYHPHIIELIHTHTHTRRSQHVRKLLIDVRNDHHTQILQHTHTHAWRFRHVRSYP